MTWLSKALSHAGYVCSALVAISTLALTTPANMLAQTTLDTAAVTMSYTGIGPITWPRSPGLRIIFAPPHFSAGPTLRCPEYVHKCEIDVVLRNVRYYTRSDQELLAELKQQFNEMPTPPTAGGKWTSRVSATRAEVTLVDERPGAQYRFTTAALIFNGPAVMQILAQSNDSASNGSVLALATQAKVELYREFMSYRFGQYVRACNVTVPASKLANEQALAASPFTDASMIESVRKRDTTFTLAKLLEIRTAQLKGFLDSFAELEVGRRESFCARLPRHINDAVTGT